MCLRENFLGFTQEIEFGRKIESVAIWYKIVVALILWFDVINGQFVDPKIRVSQSLLHGVHATFALFFQTCFLLLFCDNSNNKM